tara:strand:- start:6151 stop:6621 length:471 start_codon:yes stop_codon:yes gene_type:complete
MNFNTLVASAVVTLSLTSIASAQWSNSGGGLNIGIGGSYGKFKDKISETGANGQTASRTRTVTNNDFRWGVGMGGYSNTNNYGGGYGGGGYGGGGFYGGGGGFYGGGYGAAVMPYYGGGGYPVVIPYSPFTGCYATPMYAPQVFVPAAVCPQFIVR